MHAKPSQELIIPQPLNSELLSGNLKRRLLDNKRHINQVSICLPPLAGDRSIPFQFVTANAVDRRDRPSSTSPVRLYQLAMARFIPSPKQVISQTKQHRLTISEGCALIYCVPIAFLGFLHGERYAVQRGPHSFGLPQQIRVFLQTSQARFPRASKVIGHQAFFTAPDDDADLFNPCIEQIHDLIMHQRACDSIRADNGEELLLAGVGGWKQASPQPGYRNNRLADVHIDRIHPVGPKV